MPQLADIIRRQFPATHTHRFKSLTWGTKSKYLPKSGLALSLAPFHFHSLQLTHSLTRLFRTLLHCLCRLSFSLIAFSLLGRRVRALSHTFERVQTTHALSLSLSLSLFHFAIGTVPISCQEGRAYSMPRRRATGRKINSPRLTFREGTIKKRSDVLL